MRLMYLSEQSADLMVDTESNGDDWDEERMHIRSLITDQMWSLDPEIRDTQWRKTYGMSFPLYSTLVDELTPYLQEEYGHVMPPDAAVAMVLYRLAHGYNLRQIAAEYRLDFATITRSDVSFTFSSYVLSVPFTASLF